MDPAARKFMWKVVSNITVERPMSCVILTTHSMEEADALSTRMGIMVHGGIFKCMGSSQHIKDKFGSGYEIELKLNDLEKDEKFQESSYHRARTFTEDLHSKDGEFSLHDLAVRLNLKSKSLQDDFENSCLKMMFNHNADQYTANSAFLAPQELFKYYQTFQYLQEITRVFERQFNRVEVMESYGCEYFKIRIPRNNNSLGFMYGFIESNKTADWGLREYSVSQTTLEMIFNKFAQGDVDKVRH